ncbi:Gfo/Idh/MocA family oxidoreductase [Sediminibacterium sp. C3]|uniref:Gfo/Idh/MocA family oxidoreductase n=1 Tax=Sediminibacterium sp. C3 TaxID=1267211 RepID=UPI001F3CE07F|nr:Gfo/Idh/MocA family oxidoreductase [Sediminibacterium sp. C3]
MKSTKQSPVIKTALLSYGMSGKVFHAPFIHNHAGFELAAVWERNKKTASEDYPSIQVVQQLEEILDNDEIELVIVNTPTATHFEYAQKALLAGKHVVVEKAFTTSVKEADILIELAEKQERILSVYQNRRWDSDFQTVQKIVSQQLLGTIHTATIRFERFKDILSAKLHKEQPGPGAGLLMDLGPHIIDQALVLFGMPNAVEAHIRTLRTQSMVDDDFLIHLLYNNLRVTLISSLLVPYPVEAYLIHGSKGSLIKQRADIQESALLKQEQPFTDYWGVEPEEFAGKLISIHNGVEKVENIASLPGNYGLYYENIYSAIRHHEPLSISGTDGKNVMKIIEAAKESQAEKRQICINH